FFNMDVRADGLLPLFERHKPEVVFHLAAQAGVRPSLDDPLHDASVNLMGTLNVVECAIKVGARKVIYAASGGTIYGEPRRSPARCPPASSEGARSTSRSRRRRWRGSRGRTWRTAWPRRSRT